MARVGRKRKVGADRYPNGIVKPAEEGPSPCATKRLIMASLAGMADPQWGTVAGRYFLSGMINQNQYEAAKKYGAVCEAYAQALMGPRHPKTSTGERGSISSEVDPDSELGQIEADFHVRARQRYNQTKVVMLQYGTAVERELERFCVGTGIIPNYEDMRVIKNILTDLAELWKIDLK